MYTVYRTDEFTDWINGLDMVARVRVATRLQRAELGNLGDYKNVGSGVSEMRLDFGPGYRLYFVHQGHTIIVMLAGGDKSTQRQDIKRAKEMAKEL